MRIRRKRVHIIWGYSGYAIVLMRREGEKGEKKVEVN